MLLKWSAICKQKLSNLNFRPSARVQRLTLVRSTAVPVDMEPLVSCDWLNQKIQSGDLGNIVIVDVSWASTRDCQEEYNKCHIPGARYMNVLAADHTDLYPRNIPTSPVFTAMAQGAGINADSHVIVYSNSDRAGFFLAGRGWWTFKYYGHEKVSILDGGLQKWLQMGLPTSSEVPQYKPGNFVCGETKCHRKYEDMSQNVSSPTFQVVDSRSKELYEKGHIPGAKHLLMADLVDPDTGMLRSTQTLRQMFDDINIDLNQPVVSYCNSGMSSCTLAFAIELLQGADVRVYHGGYTEWSKKSDQ